MHEFHARGRRTARKRQIHKLYSKALTNQTSSSFKTRIFYRDCASQVQAYFMVTFQWGGRLPDEIRIPQLHQDRSFSVFPESLPPVRVAAGTVHDGPSSRPTGGRSWSARFSPIALWPYSACWVCCPACRRVAQRHEQIRNWNFLRAAIFANVARAAHPDLFIFDHLVMTEIEALQDGLSRAVSRRYLHRRARTGATGALIALVQVFREKNFQIFMVMWLHSFS